MDQTALRAVLSAAPYGPLPKTTSQIPIDVVAKFGPKTNYPSQDGPFMAVDCSLETNDPRTLFEKQQRARVLFDSEEWGPAKDAWEEVLLLCPDDTEGLYKRAACYFHFYSGKKWDEVRPEKYKQALSDLRKAKLACEKNLDKFHAAEIGKLIDKISRFGSLRRF